MRKLRSKKLLKKGCRGYLEDADIADEDVPGPGALVGATQLKGKKK